MYGEKDYAMIYRRLSKHYGTILISIRDVYWTYFNVSLHDPSASNYIVKSSITKDTAASAEQSSDPSSYLLNPFIYHMEQHPPWYVHLFMADLMAACFMKVLHDVENVVSSIDSFDTSHGNNNHYSQQLTHEELIRASLTIKSTSTAIEPPLYDVKEMMHSLCQLNSQYPLLLNVESNATYKPTKTRLYEDVVEARGSGWREYIDYHYVSGWMFNSNSNISLNKLSFPLLDDESHWNSSIRFDQYVLNVGYLRSYQGMGIVDVYVCSVFLTTLDGLNDMERFSIPMLSTLEMSSTIEDQCRLLLPSLRTIDFVYHPVEENLAVRKNRKFKLLTIQLCMPMSF